MFYISFITNRKINTDELNENIFIDIQQENIEENIDDSIEEWKNVKDNQTEKLSRLLG